MRNKYCTTCTQCERAGKEHLYHDCHKNWDGPSSSMETDILLQGFKQAEDYDTQKLLEMVIAQCTLLWFLRCLFGGML